MSMKFGTLCVHAGRAPDPSTRAVVPPIVLSTTFAMQGPGEHGGYHYARAGNPTRDTLEAALAELEGARHGIAFASGCAATSAVLLSLRAGDHVVVGQDVYSGTFRLLDRILPGLGIEASFVELGVPDALEAALRPNTRMVWVETPSNPQLRIIDIEAMAERARARGLTLVVDNTFATPLLQRPLLLGATLVLHSTTKYIGGHSDVLGGVVLTDDPSWAERLVLLQKGMGAVPSPFDCYLLMRGLSTLALRVERQVQTAERLAAWLVTRPEVERVYYPGLPGHPGAEIARRQMAGPGAIISLDLRGGMEACRAMLRATRVFTCAISLGAVESLAEHPATMTHAHVPPDVRALHGVGDSLVRLSIGVEDADDLQDDLAHALDSTRGDLQ